MSTYLHEQKYADSQTMAYRFTLDAFSVYRSKRVTPVG